MLVNIFVFSGRGFARLDSWDARLDQLGHQPGPAGRQLAGALCPPCGTLSRGHWTSQQSVATIAAHCTSHSPVVVVHALQPGLGVRLSILHSSHHPGHSLRGDELHIGCGHWYLCGEHYLQSGWASCELDALEDDKEEGSLAWWRLLFGDAHDVILLLSLTLHVLFAVG